MLKRSISLILVALMLTSTFVSCSESTDNETQNAGGAEQANMSADSNLAAEEETDYQDDLPEETFDGYEFIIYNSNTIENDWFTTNFVDFEEYSAEVLEASIYERNRMVEDRFDIDITEMYKSIDTVQTAVWGGDGTSDLNLHSLSESMGMIQQGLIYDQLKLNYLDFSKPYWDENALSLTMANKLFINAGDFLTTHYDESRTLFFNKGLVADYQLGDPYELVRNDKWTFDAFQDMMSKVGTDVDGNGIYDDNDLYGLIAYTEMPIAYFIYASGVHYGSKDENDKICLTYNDENYINVYNRVFDILYGDTAINYYDVNRGNTRGLDNNHRVQEIMFPENQSLFWIEILSWCKALREMEFDFGFLPAPKFDETQDRYYHHTSGFFGPVLPTTIKDIDRTCIILTALNSMSSGLVDVAYYDTMIKSKISRDEDSGEMLDIICNTLSYDPANEFGYSQACNGIADLMSSGSTDVASYYKKSQKSYTRMLDEAYEKISALDH